MGLSREQKQLLQAVLSRESGIMRYRMKQLGARLAAGKITEDVYVSGRAKLAARRNFVNDTRRQMGLMNACVSQYRNPAE